MTTAAPGLSAAKLSNAAPVVGAPADARNVLPTGLTDGAPLLGAPATKQKNVLAAAVLTKAARVLGYAQYAKVGAHLPANLVNAAPMMPAGVIVQKHVLTAAALANAAPIVPACVFRKNGTVVSLTDGQQFR